MTKSQEALFERLESMKSYFHNPLENVLLVYYDKNHSSSDLSRKNYIPRLISFPCEPIEVLIPRLEQILKTDKGIKTMRGIDEDLRLLMFGKRKMNHDELMQHLGIDIPKLLKSLENEEEEYSQESEEENDAHALFSKDSDFPFIEFLHFKKTGHEEKGILYADNAREDPKKADSWQKQLIKSYGNEAYLSSLQKFPEFSRIILGTEKLAETYFSKNTLPLQKIRENLEEFKEMSDRDFKASILREYKEFSKKVKLVHYAKQTADLRGL